MVFLLALFSLFLDFSMVHYITVLLHSLIYQASGLSAVECLVYATLKAHYIPSNYHSVIFPFGCTGECSRCMLFCYIKAAYKLFVLVTL